MSTFLEIIIDIEENNLSKINELFERFKNEEISSIIEYRNFIKEKYFYCKDGFSPIDVSYLDQDMINEFENREYSKSVCYDYHYLPEKEIEYLNEIFDSNYFIFLEGKYENIRIYKNFCTLNLHRIYASHFYDLKNVRDIIRKVANEIAILLGGSSILYVSEYSYCYQWELFRDYNFKNNLDLIKKIESEDEKQIDIDFIYDIFGDERPKKIFFFEQVSKNI